MEGVEERVELALAAGVALEQELHGLADADALGLALAGVMASAFLYRLGRNLVTGGVE